MQLKLHHKRQLHVIAGQFGFMPYILSALKFNGNEFVVMIMECVMLAAVLVVVLMPNCMLVCNDLDCCGLATVLFILGHFIFCS